MTRNNALDNTKFLMIFLVVFGHFIEPIANNNLLSKVVFMSIYSCHMPVFTIIAGMLTKKESNQNQNIKIINSTIIPLIAFTFLYELAEIFLNNTPSHYTKNFQPYWILWFLLSLFIWKLLLPTILTLRFPILTSIVISLIAGSTDQIGYFLGISRTIYFFPFFIIGHKLYPYFFTNKKTTLIPKYLCAPTLAFNLFIFLYLSEYPQQILYGTLSYNQLGIDVWHGSALRLALYIISLTTAISILTISIDRKTIFSNHGSNSLYVYLWHGFFIKLALATEIFITIEKSNPPITLISLAILSLLLTTALSMNFVAKITNNYIFSTIKTVLYK